LGGEQNYGRIPPGETALSAVLESKTVYTILLIHSLVEEEGDSEEDKKLCPKKQKTSQNPVHFPVQKKENSE